jgi:hypothetical protein
MSAGLSREKTPRRREYAGRIERKPVATPEAAALVAATDQLSQARQAWEAAIVAALDAGASFREVAALAGVSHGTIDTIAKRQRQQ